MKLRKTAASILGATLLAGGITLCAQSGFASVTGCGVSAGTPTRTSSGISADISRSGCGGRAVLEGQIHGVRSLMPDTDLAYGSKSLTNGSLTLTYGSPSKGYNYRSSGWDSTGGYGESGVLTY